MHPLNHNVPKMRDYYTTNMDGKHVHVIINLETKHAFRAQIILWWSVVWLEEGEIHDLYE